MKNKIVMASLIIFYRLGCLALAGYFAMQNQGWISLACLIAAFAVTLNWQED
jgi:hypothetical protein